MRYKCITKYVINNSVAMNPGDIVVIAENNLFNITSGIDYRNVSDMEAIHKCLETITDDNIYESDNIYKPNNTSDVERFENITKLMIDTFKKKNHDYGNSFEESLNEEGIVAARVRLGDKWNRFKQLSRGEVAQIKEESLKDTMLDMANYLIMTTIWLDKQK